MTGLLVVSIVIAPFALYAADRLIKMRAQTRKLRRMNQRLTAATARADKQEERRQAAVKASAELTSVVAAIKLPPPSLPGLGAHGPAKPKAGRDRKAKPDHASSRPGRRGPHSGEHAALADCDTSPHRDTGPHRDVKPKAPRH